MSYLRSNFLISELLNNILKVNNKSSIQSFLSLKLLIFISEGIIGSKFILSDKIENLKQQTDKNDILKISPDNINLIKEIQQYIIQNLIKIYDPKIIFEQSFFDEFVQISVSNYNINELSTTNQICALKLMSQVMFIIYIQNEDIEEQISRSNYNSKQMLLLEQFKEKCGEYDTDVDEIEMENNKLDESQEISYPWNKDDWNTTNYTEFNKQKVCELSMNLEIERNSRYQVENVQTEKIKSITDELQMVRSQQYYKCEEFNNIQKNYLDLKLNQENLKEDIYIHQNDARSRSNSENQLNSDQNEIKSKQEQQIKVNKQIHEKIDYLEDQIKKYELEDDKINKANESIEKQKKINIYLHNEISELKNIVSNLQFELQEENEKNLTLIEKIKKQEPKFKVKYETQKSKNIYDSKIRLNYEQYYNNKIELQLNSTTPINNNRYKNSSSPKHRDTNFEIDIDNMKLEDLNLNYSQHVKECNSFESDQHRKYSLQSHNSEEIQLTEHDHEENLGIEDIDLFEDKFKTAINDKQLERNRSDTSESDLINQTNKLHLEHINYASTTSDEYKANILNNIRFELEQAKLDIDQTDKRFKKRDDQDEEKCLNVNMQDQIAKFEMDLDESMDSSGDSEQEQEKTVKELQFMKKGNNNKSNFGNIVTNIFNVGGIIYNKIRDKKVTKENKSNKNDDKSSNSDNSGYQINGNSEISTPRKDNNSTHDEQSVQKEYSIERDSYSQSGDQQKNQDDNINENENFIKSINQESVIEQSEELPKLKEDNNNLESQTGMLNSIFKF